MLRYLCPCHLPPGVGQLSTILPVGGVRKPTEAGRLLLVCLPAWSCCPEVGTAISTQCQTCDEYCRVSQVLNLGDPTHVLRRQKKKKCEEGGLSPGCQSGFSPQPQEESGQQMAAERARASLQGLRPRKGVHDLGSCKLRPGDLQAFFVRKRFHKGGYYVSILSLSSAPGQLHSHPFQALQLGQYKFLPLGQGHPSCWSH